MNQESKKPEDICNTFSQMRVYSNKSIEGIILVSIWKKRITEDYTQYASISEKVLQPEKENKFYLGLHTFGIKIAF